MMLINDLSARIREIDEKLKAAVNGVIDSGWVVLGPQVKQFEQAFADYLGAAHCVGVANGTDALELALKAFCIGSGDRVATVANSGMYTTSALIAINAEPVYMDVDLNSKTVSLQEVNRAIDMGAKAVVVTHLFGLMVPEIEDIAKLCAERDVWLLEDCAQAHGARYAGKKAGTFGDAAAFSFYPTKNLGALGDAGAVTTDNPSVAEMVLRLRQYGWTSKYKVDYFGARNSRLDELQAAVLSAFLPTLDIKNERRRAIATTFSESICHPDIKLPPVYGRNYVAHLYVVQVDSRNAFRQHLRQHEVMTEVHYPIPDHRQQVFGSRYLDIKLLNTEILADEICTLPCYPEMTDEQVAKVISAVNSWDGRDEY
jgi:aminotransferase EvaB